MNTKIILPLVISLILTSCSSSTQEVTLDLMDYGAVVDSEETDNGPMILALLQDARTAHQEGKSVKILLPHGNLHIYSNELPQYELYISNHDHLPLRYVALMIDNLSNLSIIGENTKLQFHGRLIPFVIKESSNIELRGFSIDYPRPAMSQIEVLSIDPTNNNVEVAVLPETHYSIQDHRFIIHGEGYDLPMQVTLAFNAQGRLKWGRSDVAFNPKEIIELEPHNLLLVNWEEAPHLEVGDKYALRSYYRPTPAISIMDSEQVLIEDVQVRFSEGMGIIAQHSKDITLDGFEVSIERNSERFFTSGVDATHFSGCSGTIISTNGLYEGMGDDAINVHGTYLRVDSILNPYELIATFAHGQSFGFTWYEEGDTLRLISRETLLPLLVTKAQTVKRLSPKQFRIVLNESIPHSPDPLAIENLSRHPEVIFSNNTIRNNRARGALFSTPRRVLCEDNIFDHVHGSAILLTGDANGWYESGPCEEVIIRGNHFINTLTSLYQFTDGIISISPQMPRLVEGQYYHGKVVIEGNTFEGFPSPLYYARSLRELIFKDNQIIENNDFPSHFDDNRPQAINVGKIEKTTHP